MRISDWSSDVCSSDLWRRILAPETGAEYAALLYIIKGAEEVNGGKAGPEALAAEAIDDRTLKVELTSPAPYFLAQLAHQTAFPLPKHAVAVYGRDWTKHEKTVVKGAYKVISWTPKVEAKLVKTDKINDTDKTTTDQRIARAS